MTLANRIVLVCVILLTAACSGPQPRTLPTIERSDWASHIDPNVLGRGNVSDLAFYAFSQVNVDQNDPQVTQLAPDINIRAWQRWRRQGTEAAHYNQAYIKSYEPDAIAFIGGSTSSVLFPEETEFRDRVSVDSSGQPVVHDHLIKGLSRGSLANPTYRDYLVNIGKIQIDLGVDGLFFDEVNAGYDGEKLDGNEGFDDFHLAAFNQYLCDRFSSLSHDDLNRQFSMPSENRLNCDAPLNPATNFNYRRYLSDRGISDQPRSHTNPLAGLWGSTTINRPQPASGSFVETSVTTYWQDIVLRLREYARQEHNKEILITSNGLFPFVDFQSVGLYAYNKDRQGHEQDYVPVKGKRLNGSVSLLDAFKRLRQASEKLTGDAPVVVFIDWPGTYISRFYGFTPQERKDYFRLFASEAYAIGMFYALPLRTSMPGDPTATDLNMMDFFARFGGFFQNHRDIYTNAKVAEYSVRASVKSVATSVTTLPDGRIVVHLINHQYDKGIVPQQDLRIHLQNPGMAVQSATLISHDFPEVRTVAVTHNNQAIEIPVDKLDSYLAIILPRPLH